MNKIPLTQNGADTLRRELQELKTVDRPSVIKAIAEARAHGDLKENAEYHAAREQQGFIEARIADIEYKVSNSQVIDVTKMPPTGRVIFGATVSMLDVDTEQEVRYHIVGEDEANIREGRISVSSPIARAMIGKEEGDEISLQTPGGDKCFEILKVDYI